MPSLRNARRFGPTQRPVNPKRSRAANSRNHRRRTNNQDMPQRVAELQSSPTRSLGPTRVETSSTQLTSFRSQESDSDSDPQESDHGGVHNLSAGQPSGITTQDQFQQEDISGSNFSSASIRDDESCTKTLPERELQGFLTKIMRSKRANEANFGDLQELGGYNLLKSKYSGKTLAMENLTLSVGPGPCCEPQWAPLPTDFGPITHYEGQDADGIGVQMCDKLSPVLSMVLEHIDPSSVLAMLKVCKRWRHRLMNPFGSYYHLHVWKNFPYTKPGPAWRFEVFWNTALKHKAVKDGSLHLVGRIPLLDQHQHEVGGYSKRLFWYHSGLVCFYQPWEVNKVALYDLKNMKPGIPVPPKYFSANPRAYIVSANVGGTPNSGTYLVYCVYQHRKKPTQIFCHLIDESSATKSSENKGKRRDIPLQAKILNIPEEHEILFKAQGAIQTNGSTVVLVTKSKILAWDITGGRFLGFQFLNNRDGRMENLKIGQIWISETLVFVISWVPDFGSWVTAFSLKNLTLVEDFGLGKCGPIYQISSSLSGNRLFVARAFPNEEHVIKGSWTQSCLDNSGVSEGRPIECRDVPDFPSFKDAVHARIISYPDHGRALIARQAGFGQNSPESELLMVEVGTGKIIKAVHSAKGYNTALMIDDGLKLTRKLVQGDTEWVVWCTRGELLVFHFSSKESDAIYTHLSSIPSSVSSSPFEHCQFDD